MTITPSIQQILTVSPQKLSHYLQSQSPDEIKALKELKQTWNAHIVFPKIKELGTYEAEVRLHRSVSISIPFKVIEG